MTPNKQNTSAVTVLYYPSPDNLQNLLFVSNIVDKLFVICNSCLDHKTIMPYEKCNIIFIQNKNNIGLAAALNIGVKQSLANNYTWTLLLDQDTYLKKNILEVLGALYDDFPNDKNHIGILAPNYISNVGDKVAFSEKNKFLSIRSAITSGSLISLKHFMLIGEFKSKLFIESIDTEYCLRLRYHGFLILASGTVLMKHDAGESTMRLFFGRKVLISNHDPNRCYLQFRNLTSILIRYFWFDPQWAFNTIISIIKRLTLILLFEQNKFKKFYKISIGIKNGLFFNPW